jgi:SAM-dependent methyltransferase
MKIICDICGNEMNSEFIYDSEFTYYRCSICSYFKRIPDTLKINYNSEYMNLDLIFKSKRLANNYYRRFNKYIKKGTKTLEIGGSFGFFSKILKTYLECDAYNVESSLLAVDYANKLGIKSFEKIEDIEQERFDNIFSFHVIEHIEPKLLKPLIAKLYKLLNNDGSLILATPNASSKKLKLFKKRYGWLAPEEHISFLSKDSALELLKDFSFSSILIKSAIPSFIHYPSFSIITKIRNRLIHQKVSDIIPNANSFSKKTMKGILISMLKRIFHFSILLESLLYYPFLLIIDIFSKEYDELIIICRK